jgi:GNAT superfamily N-acetyltransferase
MARVGLEQLDIPTNPAIEIEVIDGTNDASIEARLQIVATCFNWTKEQADARRSNFFERAKDPKVRENEIGYLARLNGKPVADSRVILSTGIAYLGGASTLPDYRGQKIYSTLLRKRLEAAHARGYNVAAIHAEPMSRRVVSKYGFKEYGKAYVYGWMPVMDMKIIMSLVPDD